jgi:hypothetical protein
MSYIVLISNKTNKHHGVCLLGCEAGMLGRYLQDFELRFKYEIFSTITEIIYLWKSLCKKVNCLWNSQIWHNNLFIQQILLTEKNIFQLSRTCLGAKHEIVLNGNVRTDIYLS